MDNCVKILVFDEEELTKTLIENYLKDVSFPFSLQKYNDFNEACIKESNDEKIIIININKLNADNLLRSVSAYSGKKNSFIVISYDKSTDLNVRILRAGAVEFLQKPLIKQDFLYVLQKIYKQKALGTTADKDSKIFTAVSCNNGEGKTNILINTAKEIADLTKEKVLLIDFNDSLGDISFILNMDIEYNSNYYFNNLNEGNSDKLLNTIQAYKNSSLYVMANGFYRTASGKINLQRFDSVMEILKKHFKYIFIDICKDEDILEKNIVRNSDAVFYVVLPNEPFAEKIKQSINLTYKNKKIYLICNKYEVKSEPNLVKLKDILELPVAARIPKNFMAAMVASNSRKTLKEAGKELDIVKAFNKLAQYIIGRE